MFEGWSSLGVPLSHKDQTEEVIVKILRREANNIFSRVTFKLIIYDIPLFEQVLCFHRTISTPGEY